MPFPTDIDFDKVAAAVLHDTSHSIRQWLRGRPLSEEPLMNSITGNFARGRHGCDVGVLAPTRMTSQLALLHRKGVNQTDLYGSDIAVTVYIDQIPFAKTAFFQLKISHFYSCSLDITQINQAHADMRVWNRAFALAIDQDRQGVRIEKLSTIEPTFPAGQQSKTFDTTQWEFLTLWLHKWLSCDIGEATDLTDPNAIEKALQRYVDTEEENDTWISPWGFDTTINSESKSEIIPAKAWLVFLIETANNEISLVKKYRK
jgi:hypothetical protein